MKDLLQGFRHEQREKSGALFMVGVYLLWAAVGLHPLFEVIRGRLPWNLSTAVGLIGLLAFPALFALTGVSRRQTAEPPFVWAHAFVPLEALAALAACWGLGSTTMDSSALAALLVVPAAQVPSVYRRLTGFLLILAFDIVLVLLLSSQLHWGVASRVVFAYAGFQLFAALTMTSFRRADRARDEAARINAELVATRQLLLEGARGEERLRLSRDLHDIVGHKLTGLKLQLRLCARAAAPTVQPFVDECMRLADELLTDVRGVVGALRAADGIDLHESLAALVPAVPRPQIRLELAPDARVASVEQAQTLLRCAQEGLTNALRHSGARNVVMRLARSDDGVSLSIEDDGEIRVAPRWGNGLRGMQERLSMFGGTLEVVTAKAGGLTVRAWLPQVESREMST